MNISENIKSIKDAVTIGDYQKVGQLTQIALDAKENPVTILREGVYAGIKAIHDKHYSKSKVFPTSQIFLGFEAARVSVEMINPHIQSNENKITVVLGTLEGDTHDVGTKWLALTLLTGGYNVKYLGRDIRPQHFVHKAIQTDADVICVSCHQTTAYNKIDELLKLIDQSKDELSKEVFVMAGGSVITDKYAKLKGLGYADSSVQVVELLDKRFN